MSRSELVNFDQDVHLHVYICMYSELHVYTLSQDITSCVHNCTCAHRKLTLQVQYTLLQKYIGTCTVHVHVHV